MKLLFDSSVWIEHLRHGVLGPVIPALRGRFILWFDAVSAAELRAGCRSKRERLGVNGLLSPFEEAGRVATPEGADYVRAATALSRLREAGKTLKQPGGALLDALISSVGVRLGALVVTANTGDFAMLASVQPLRVQSLGDFVGHLSTLAEPSR